VELLVAFRTLHGKITQKPDRTTTPTLAPEKLVSLRMFRRCFQFQFNIRFVQFRKIFFCREFIFSAAKKTVCTFELINFNRTASSPPLVQKREQKYELQLNLISSAAALIDCG
jgi:hypothetical protein